MSSAEEPVDDTTLVIPRPASPLTCVSSPRQPVDPTEAPLSLLHYLAVNGDRQTLQKLVAVPICSLRLRDSRGRTALMMAALGDRSDNLGVLLKAGSDPDLADFSGRTALHWASYKGYHKCVRVLLNRDADWNLTDTWGSTCLHLASRHTDARGLGHILKRVRTVEVPDAEKNTPLHWAASYARHEAVRMLLRRGANVALPNARGRTPLHCAASATKGNPTACLRLLLAAAPSVASWQDYEGRTALHLALADGCDTSLTTLLSGGIRGGAIDAADNLFRTPLHWAAMLRGAGAASALLKAGADITARDAHGATPLHYAAQGNAAATLASLLTQQDQLPPEVLAGALVWAAARGADDAVTMLTSEGVAADAPDEKGVTAIHAAAFNGRASAMTILLQDEGVVDARDSSQCTPLHRASQMGRLEVATLLLSSGADVDARDAQGRLPVHWAALGGHTSVLRLFKDSQCDARDNCGRVPLHLSAMRGHRESTVYLLEEADSDVDSCDQSGATPLHFAALEGRLEIISVLMDFAASLTILSPKGAMGLTPFDVSVSAGMTETARHLRAIGAKTGQEVRDEAAIVIQAWFRGSRFRRNFLPTLELLQRHERLKEASSRRRIRGRELDGDEVDDDDDDDDVWIPPANMVSEGVSRFINHVICEVERRQRDLSPGPQSGDSGVASPAVTTVAEDMVSSPAPQVMSPSASLRSSPTLSHDGTPTPRRYSKYPGSGWEKQSTIFLDIANSSVERAWGAASPNVEVSLESQLEGGRRGKLPDGAVPMPPGSLSRPDSTISNRFKNKRPATKKGQQKK